MSWDAVGSMVTVSVAVSTLMAFMVSLMIKSAIAEATNRITYELHNVVSTQYVRREVYDLELKELRAALNGLHRDQ